MMSGNIVQGSEEWFRQIAGILVDTLIGMEWVDSRGTDTTPPLQVLFFVPWDGGKVGLPKGVNQVKGFFGLHATIREDTVFGAIVFNFYSNPFPTKEVFEKIAEEYGLTIRENAIWTPSYFGLYSQQFFD